MYHLKQIDEMFLCIENLEEELSDIDAYKDILVEAEEISDPAAKILEIATEDLKKLLNIDMSVSTESISDRKALALEATDNFIVRGLKAIWNGILWIWNKIKEFFKKIFGIKSREVQEQASSLGKLEKSLDTFADGIKASISALAITEANLDHASKIREKIVADDKKLAKAADDLAKEVERSKSPELNSFVMPMSNGFEYFINEKEDGLKEVEKLFTLQTKNLNSFLPEAKRRFKEITSLDISKYQDNPDEFYAIINKYNKDTVEDLVKYFGSATLGYKNIDSSVIDYLKKLMNDPKIFDNTRHEVIGPFGNGLVYLLLIDEANGHSTRRLDCKMSDLNGNLGNVITVKTGDNTLSSFTSGISKVSDISSLVKEIEAIESEFNKFTKEVIKSFNNADDSSKSIESIIRTISQDLTAFSQLTANIVRGVAQTVDSTSRLLKAINKRMKLSSMDFIKAFKASTSGDDQASTIVDKLINSLANKEAAFKAFDDSMLSDKPIKF